MPIDNNSLKTLLEKPVTAGPGETSPPKVRGWPEAYTNVLHAPPPLPTKINNSTIESQLYSPISDSPVGTSTPSGYLSQLMDGMSCVAHATMPRQNEKEQLEQSLNALGKILVTGGNEAKGLKYDAGKPPLAYIPKAALYAEGEAFAFGAKKYESWNYKNGLLISRTLSAALRHIAQFLDGQNNDNESGVNHLGCARANLGMALDTLANHPEMDDRWKKK